MSEQEIIKEVAAIMKLDWECVISPSREGDLATFRCLVSEYLVTMVSWLPRDIGTLLGRDRTTIQACLSRVDKFRSIRDRKFLAAADRFYEALTLIKQKQVRIDRLHEIQQWLRNNPGHQDYRIMLDDKYHEQTRLENINNQITQISNQLPS